MDPSALPTSGFPQPNASLTFSALFNFKQVNLALILVIVLLIVVVVILVLVKAHSVWLFRKHLQEEQRNLHLLDRHNVNREYLQNFGTDGRLRPHTLRATTAAAAAGGGGGPAAAASAAGNSERKGFTPEVIGQLGKTFPFQEQGAPAEAAAAARDSGDDVECATARECVVCLAEYHSNDVLRRLDACGHAFHQDCIDAWLATSRSCPLCRTELRPPRPAGVSRGVPSQPSENAAAGSNADESMTAPLHTSSSAGSYASAATPSATDRGESIASSSS